MKAKIGEKMNIIDRIKHILAKWLWRNNAWTKAVDEVEDAVDRLRKGEVDEVHLYWYFSFLRPPNRFSVSIRLENKEKS